MCGAMKNVEQVAVCCSTEGQGHYFIWPTSLFQYAVSRCGPTFLTSVYCIWIMFSEKLPWVAWPTVVTFRSRFVIYTSNFCWWNWRHWFLNPKSCKFSVRILAVLFILQHVPPLHIALVRLASEEAAIPSLLLSPTTLCKQRTELFGLRMFVTWRCEYLVTERPFAL